MYFSRRALRGWQKKVVQKKYLFLYSLPAFFLFLLGVGGVFFFSQTVEKQLSEEVEIFSSELNIADTSPLGAAGGLVVPASCPSDPHDAEIASCTSLPNACGRTNSGWNACGGGCSAATPSNNSCPAQCGTVANTCLYGNGAYAGDRYNNATAWYWGCGKNRKDGEGFWEFIPEIDCSKAKSDPAPTPTINVYFP